MAGLRLAFMGTPEFALPVLKALAAAGHDIACVYTQPPRPAGRGQAVRPSPVAVWAAQNALTVRWPVSLKAADAQAAFAALRLDAAIVVAYGLILPPAILGAPRWGCVNVHASLLPRWRGAAPIQRAILAGDQRTGISIMQMDAGLDTGPVFASEAIAIDPDETGGSLHDKLSQLGASLMASSLAGIIAGTLTARPQPEDGVTYATKIAKAEAEIDWRQPADLIHRQIRAFNPWPGAWTVLAGQRLKILSTRIVDGASLSPGQRAARRLTVGCGDGRALDLNKVQPHGKRAMMAQDFLNGLRDDQAEILPCPAIN